MTRPAERRNSLGLLGAFPRTGDYALRILIADDHEIVRKGLCFILESHRNTEICGEAKNGQDAVEKATELNPDLIILDVTMPGLDGFAAARRIRTFLPEVPILMLSMHEGPLVVREARQAGAQGFVSKTDAGHVLLKAVDAIFQGQTFFPS
jgi:two-component system, NarL family, response regulator NreC